MNLEEPSSVFRSSIVAIYPRAMIWAKLLPEGHQRSGIVPVGPNRELMFVYANMDYRIEIHAQ